MGAKSSRPPEEAATVLLGAHFPEPFARQFRVLAAQRGLTIKALLAEAIAEKMAKPPEEIASATPADLRRID